MPPLRLVPLSSPVLSRLSKKREEWVARGHGELTEVDEKGFFSSVKGEERAVALFVRSSRPCEILTEHVRRLAPLHLETLFVKVDAEKAPFLADRLKLWMLPTLAVVKNGSVEHYIVGLDDFGGTADFPTARVEDRLADLGAIRPRGEGVGRTGQPGAGPPGRAPATGVRRGGFQVTSEDEDSDFD